jgi:uncharacterized protein
MMILDFTDFNSSAPAEPARIAARPTSASASAAKTRLSPSTMSMWPVISAHRQALAELCRRFGVERLELFGSAATSAFRPGRSDLDFLVRFPSDYDFGPWMARWQEFQEQLAAIVDAPVDVVTESALRNPWFRREAEKTRTLIYDASQDPEMASRHS